MTASVAKQKVFVPTISTGLGVTLQRVFVTVHIPTGAVVSAQRVFAPVYYDASLALTRRRNTSMVV